MMTVSDIIDRYYPAGTLRRDIYIRHCASVAEEALSIAERKNLSLSRDEIHDAAMLHDIGIFLTYAPGIGCDGDMPYITHGTAGADLLRKHGFPEKYARVAERHTGAGITPDDIALQNLPLPADRILVPETLLERLICYADKFYSKGGDMKRKPLEKVRASMLGHSESTLERFDALSAEFL